MELKLASMKELPQLKVLYQELVQHMEQHDLHLWDEIYPCEFLENDIRQEQLYLLLEQAEILAAFALCQDNAGADQVGWRKQDAPAMYLDRLGVNVQYARTGIGSKVLEAARGLAKEMGADYLRLFVIDENIPAIRLYQKAGFEMAEGIYHEVIDEELTFHEFGFEHKTIVE